MMRITSLLVLSAALCFGQASPVTPRSPRPCLLECVPHLRAASLTFTLAITYRPSTTPLPAATILFWTGAPPSRPTSCSINNAPHRTGFLVEGAGCNTGAVAIPVYGGLRLPPIFPVTPIPFAAPTLTGYATLTSASSQPLVTTDSGFTQPGSFNYFGCLEVATPLSFQFALVASSEQRQTSHSLVNLGTILSWIGCTSTGISSPQGILSGTGWSFRARTFRWSIATSPIFTKAQTTPKRFLGLGWPRSLLHP